MHVKCVFITILLHAKQIQADKKNFPVKVLKFHHFSLRTFSLTKIFPEEVFSDKVFNQNWNHDITYDLEPVSDMWSYN